MKNTLFISDLDGTLLKSDGTLSDYTAGVLNGLIDNGLNFSVATARSVHSAGPLIGKLKLRLPIVTQNGVFIQHLMSDEKLYCNSFSADERYIIKRLFEELNVHPLVFSMLDNKERVIWKKGSETKGILSYINSRKNDIRLRFVENRTEFLGEMFYFTYIGSFESCAKLKCEFAKLDFCNVLFYEDIYSSEYLCEIMPRNATKRNGVLALKEMLGFERIICFGDNLNDISMFEIADIACAVENSVDELKCKADYVVPSNDNDGVAGFIKKYFEQALKNEVKHIIE